MTGLPCRLSTLDQCQGIYLLSLTSLLFIFFFLQRCPLSQLVLRVKLFDIGPPKAILNLALQPPDTDDIERTILLFKQVWDWFHHTILLGLPIVPYIWQVMQTCLSRLGHTIHCDLSWGWEGLRGGKQCPHKVGWYGFLSGSLCQQTVQTWFAVPKTYQ